MEAPPTTERIRELEAEVEALRRYKAFTHSYLDQHGVPHGDPDNPHQQEGCRIGARLDLLFRQRDEARAEVERLRAELKEEEEAANEARDDLVEMRETAIARAERAEAVAKAHAELSSALDRLLLRYKTGNFRGGASDADRVAKARARVERADALTGGEE